MNKGFAGRLQLAGSYGFLVSLLVIAIAHSAGGEKRHCRTK
jgi:hypothetical protein